MNEAAPNLLELSPDRRALLERLLQAEQPRGIRPLAPGNRRPLSFAQERMWLAERFAQGIHAGISTSRLSIHGPLDVAALQRSLHEIVRRHEVLRTAYV